MTAPHATLAEPRRRRPGSLRALAAATPASRDRYVDFLRVASIAVVVLGHWLMAVVTVRDGRVWGGNALAELPGLWPATWLLQVMPLFFLVGGFSNRRALAANARRGGSYHQFMAGRAARLMRPTLVFVAAWLGLAPLLDLAGVADGVLGPATAVLARPLWFLGLYLLVVALAPAMLRLHRRFGALVAVVLGLAVALADLARLGFGVDAVGYLNFLLVWLFAHQLGFLYADGTLDGRRVPAAMAVLGLAGLAALTGLGWYPASMVGLPGDPASNMDPPSLCIVALTVWLTGLVVLARGPVTRWLARPRVWTAVVGAGSAVMTVFLWHLSALFLGVALLYPLGFPQPPVGTAAWWLLRPVWVAALLALLVPLVMLFARFERPGTPGAPARVGDGRPAATVPAVLLLVLGTLGFAVGGFHPLTGNGATLVVLPVSPVGSLACLAAGMVGLRLGSGARSGSGRSILPAG